MDTLSWGTKFPPPVSGVDFAPVSSAPASIKASSESHSGHVNTHSGLGRFAFHIPPESIFTSPRNPYSQFPGTLIHMPRNLHLRVRRDRCRYRNCPRKIFTERLPRVARSYSRHTARLAEIVRLVGYAVGGLPGQRLLERLAVSVSDDTILRRIKAPPVHPPSPEPICHLGVDDGAWRKGGRTTEPLWWI
jgi:hypothetical protein